MSKNKILFFIGDHGETGPPGHKGPTGADGFPGRKGILGDTGLPGQKGLTGIVHNKVFNTLDHNYSNKG